MNFRQLSFFMALLFAMTINVSCDKDEIIDEENVSIQQPQTDDVQSVKKSEIEEDDT